MAGNTEKLYPPTIGSSMPAFYQENGAATIVVPFSMNRAVSSDDFQGFRIKIKTVQSNRYIRSIDCYEKSNALTNREARFVWDNIDNNQNYTVKLGQYLKIQMAYIGNDGTIGYFSTVGIIKYTSKPQVSIERMSSAQNVIPSFEQQYCGVYRTTEDKSERPYSYCFFLYDFQRGLVETSGWKLHNTSINTTMSESLSLEKTSDIYRFTSLLVQDQIYYIQYAVRTINNLEVYSPMYACMDCSTTYSSLQVDLVAENVFEEGYIELKFAKKDPNAVLNLDESVSIEICRSSKIDGYTSWLVLKRQYFTNYTDILKWRYLDFTIEQGITYKYCFRQYNSTGVLSERTESNLVLSDFEDMFLWDGKKQLKIRFNPKVSSFKTTRFEQKIDTIGSKYPFIFRNGIVSYKEFPIAGLISYKADNNEWFIKATELDLISTEDARRGNSPVNQDNNDYNNSDNPVYSGKSWERSEILDSTGYNMRAERLFKLKLLDWLGNGQIKMFKSPQEGNYLVRLLNVSLTPEDRVGRMLHNFSCTAYEVEELTYNNLLDLEFLNPADEVEVHHTATSVSFKTKITNADISDPNQSIKINDNNILNYFAIKPTNAPDNDTPESHTPAVGFFVRLGADTADNRVYIQPQGLIFNTGFSFDKKLPDVYFNINDNLELIEDSENNDLTNLINQCNDLVGDSILTYWYNNAETLIGEFNNLKRVYIKNEISTSVGPETLNFTHANGLNTEVLRFFVLDFQKKVIKKVVLNNGKYYDFDPYPNNKIEIIHFDEISMYEIYGPNKGNQPVSIAYYKNNSLHVIDGSINTSISLIDVDGNSYSFNEPPVLNLNDNLYTQIVIGNGIILNAAYQMKIVEYNT